MSEQVIITARETIFFSHNNGQLCQWILVTIENRSEQSRLGLVAITTHEQEARTTLEIVPGVREYRCHAPTLWPEVSQGAEATVCLWVGQEASSLLTTVGAHRPWTLYLLSDVCTDYTWVYDDEQACRRDDAALLEAELTLAEGDAPDNHYNLVHAREVEFYLERYPEKSTRLFDHIRRGTVTLNPLLNLCLTGDMSLEELIRQLYPARALAMKYGLEIGYANHQETPTIAWAMASVLAGSGIKHLVKSIYPYEYPWAKRLEEPPVFYWEGPDGRRVLVRRCNEHYSEGAFVLRGLRNTNTAIHDRFIPRYEASGADYPFDAIGLIGCYNDLSPQSPTLPAKKAATIAAYNAQGWEYPRLVNGSHAQFWADVERQIASGQASAPTFRGDYGSSWETWPASLAYDFAQWRRAQERASTADKLVSILAAQKIARPARTKERLGEGWSNLLYLADHAWNGANDGNRALNASLRRRWQLASNEAFDSVIESSLQELAQHVPTGDDKHILVFNGLPWVRTGIVGFAESATGSQVVDAASGEPMLTQIVEKDGQTKLHFEVRDVPPLGYRVFALKSRPSAQGAEGEESGSPACALESPFYRIEASTASGGIVSLYDKIRGQELVDASSPYHLNQCLYLSENIEHTPRAAHIRRGSCGPLFSQLIVEAELKNARLVSTITLYHHLDRLDIRNELKKLPTSEKQELDFVFPFRVPRHEYRYEAPGVIIAPGKDQRPGAGQAVTAIRHFVDVFNDEYGVTLAQAGAGLVEFGHRTTAEDLHAPDMASSTIFSLAMENCIDWDEAIRDQGGNGHFVFRYSLRGHAGSFDPVAAIHFAWENNNELLTIPLVGNQQGALPANMQSFVSVNPVNVILTTAKVAEEEGLIFRLWECSGQETTARVDVNGLGDVRAVYLTDLLERDDQPLPLENGVISVQLRGWGLATLRLVIA